MRAVIAGCGTVSRAWFKDLTNIDGIQIVGLVDILEENSQVLKAEQGMPAGTLTGTNLRKIIEESSADTVFDCTIPQAHYSVITTALECGCNVLGEKPLAETLDQAREMVRLAEEKGKTYAVIQNRRYLDSIQTTKSLLDDGRIGKPHTYNADFYLGCHFGGFRDEMDHVLLLDMAIHSFDQARFLCPSRPVKVYCHEYNPPGSWYAHSASAMAIFQMEDGSVFNYRGSWCAEGLNTSWQCDWRIIGERGSLIWDGENSIVVEEPDEDEGFLRRSKREVVPVLKILEHISRSGVIAEFYNAVQQGRVPHTSGRDNIKSLAMVLAAIRSAEDGKPVNIEYSEDDLPFLKQET